jgi:hypothetical protein
MNRTVPVAVESDVSLQLFAAALTEAGFAIRYSGEGLQITRSHRQRAKSRPAKRAARKKSQRDNH